MSTVRLSDSLVDGINPVYYTEGFHSMMEHHVSDLIISEASQTISVPETLANRFHGDLNGLLTSLGVPLQYHWVTMRCNDLYGANEYPRTLLVLIQPDFSEIDQLLAIYTTKMTSSIQ